MNLVEFPVFKKKDENFLMPKATSVRWVRVEKVPKLKKIGRCNYDYDGTQYRIWVELPYKDNFIYFRDEEDIHKEVEGIRSMGVRVACNF